MNRITIMVVDDEEYLLENIKDYLENYAVSTFSDPVQALKALNTGACDILVVDYKMPGMAGLELLRKARQINAYKYGILSTAYADKNMVQASLNEGLISLSLDKPLVLRKFKAVIDDAIKICTGINEKEQKLSQWDEFRKQLAKEGEAIIGHDKGLKDICREVQNIADRSIEILLLGETGTGKEVIARLIHRLSQRSGKLFVDVNCAAIPDTIIESELFGTVEGSFTDAVDKVGKIELANGGTLFLDEIGEMKPEVQAKLLRVLDKKQVQKLGSNKTIDVDFRLITATNRDLETAIKEKSFREDLYYRINSYPIRLPALRERKEDIADFISFYMPKFCRVDNLEPHTLADDALQVLLHYQWPGNVRELKNVIRRVLNYKHDGHRLTAANFEYCLKNQYRQEGSYQTHIAALRDLIIDRKLNIDDIKRDVLKAILDIYDGNPTKASKATGINRGKFYNIKDSDEYA